MATSNYSNPESLAELSTLVERTLVDTARLFRKPASGPSRTNLQRSIPSYYDSFQDALDNLSEQIYIAKAFLEKDYEAIKAREAASQLTEDVAMGDVDQKVESEPQPPPSEKMEGGTGLEKVPLKTEEVPVEELAADRVTPKDQAGDTVAIKEEKENVHAAPADQAFPGTAQDISFESVLHETGGSGSFDLNLDFGDDDMGNQAFLSGSAFGTAGVASGDDKPSTSQPPAGVTNAFDGGGTFDMELQKTEGDPNQLPEQGNAAEDIMGPGESSFDDLFLETDNLGDTGAGDLGQLEGDSLMNISELDDDWFT